jgi:hypothetical protein
MVERENTEDLINRSGLELLVGGRSAPGSISIVKHGKQSRGNSPALSSPSELKSGDALGFHCCGPSSVPTRPTITVFLALAGTKARIE